MDETRFDKIEIKELEIFANHGVYPEENVLGQKFVISATLFTHTRQGRVNGRSVCFYQLRRSQPHDYRFHQKTYF